MNEHVVTVWIAGIVVGGLLLAALGVSAMVFRATLRVRASRDGFSLLVRSAATRNRSVTEWFNCIRSRQVSMPQFQRTEASGSNEVAGLLTTVLRGLPDFPSKAFRTRM